MQRRYYSLAHLLITASLILSGAPFCWGEPQIGDPGSVLTVGITMTPTTNPTQDTVPPQESSHLSGDATAKFLGEVSPLSEVSVEDRETAEKRARMVASVREDLMNRFGYDASDLDAAIAAGLISINVDLRGLKAVVRIRGKAPLPEFHTMFGILGIRKPPRIVRYQLREVEQEGPKIACIVQEDGSARCPPEPPPIYTVERIEFNASGLQFRGDPIGMEVFRKRSGRIIKEIRYRSYADDFEEIPVFKSWPDSLHAEIDYHRARGDVTSRDVTLVRLEDGRLHIRFAVDRNALGERLIISEMVYRLRVGKMEVDSIERRDAAGNLMSTIQEVEFHKAEIILAGNGRSVKIRFDTFEDLLSKASRLEQTENL